MKNVNIKAQLCPALKNVALVIIGTLILALGTAVFIIPFDLVVGGVSSIAIIIDKLIPLEFVTIDLLVTVITWGLFFIGLFVLGKSFALKTLISTIIYPIGISVFSRLVDPQMLGGFFNLSTSEYTEIAVILAAFFGGILIGAGCAIAFLGGGSTGGTDVLAFLICKVFKRLKSSKVIFAVDAITILLGVFIIKDLVLTLLGIVSAFIGAVVIDKIFLGGSKAFIAQIITDKYDDISNDVIERLERTTTIIDAVGAYSKEPKKMVMVSFTMSQYAELINIINRRDKLAFVTVHQAHEIYGEDWTR